MDKLAEFVSEQIKKGTSPDELKSHLVMNGWNEKDVNSAINEATGRKTRNRVILVFLGLILIGALVFGLVSFAKNTNFSQDEISVPNIQNKITETNSNSANTNKPSDECSLKETSAGKNDCYKALLKTNFSCDSLNSSVEKTYCARAYEEMNLQGVEQISESN